jgi:hypothetical protein
VTVLGGALTSVLAVLIVLPGLCAATKRGRHHAVTHRDEPHPPDGAAQDEVRAKRAADDELASSGALA